MKAFLLDFDATQSDRKSVTKLLDQMPIVHDWFAFLANTICIVSEDDAPALSRAIRSRMPDVRFIVVEIDPKKKGGWLSIRRVNDEERKIWMHPMT